jgi:hypothetical protein
VRARTLGVGLSGIGWCASTHIYHTRFTAQTTMEACLAADLSAERGASPCACR